MEEGRMEVENDRSERGREEGREGRKEEWRKRGGWRERKGVNQGRIKCKHTAFTDV